MKIRRFSSFFAKLAVAERVSKAGTIVVGSVGDLTSLSEFILPETNGSGVFWVKMGDFSTFW